eukprot:TRINITY_DN64419_c0_g1_i3.p1 TRINITY_DN64419_c0_g1~~TRINITY_DN64419_c0_g1_i3.p1  ORF type:complete len:684 (-),score=50.74 TRINITY_DN64419_c0_g1_i3:60-2111(-)
MLSMHIPLISESDTTLCIPTPFFGCSFRHWVPPFRRHPNTPSVLHRDTQRWCSMAWMTPDKHFAVLQQTGGTHPTLEIYSVLRELGWCEPVMIDKHKQAVQLSDVPMRVRERVLFPDAFIQHGHHDVTTVSLDAHDIGTTFMLMPVSNSEGITCRVNVTVRDGLAPIIPVCADNATSPLLRYEGNVVTTATVELTEAQWVQEAARDEQSVALVLADLLLQLQRSTNSDDSEITSSARIIDLGCVNDGKTCSAILSAIDSWNNTNTCTVTIHAPPMKTSQQPHQHAPSATSSFLPISLIICCCCVLLVLCLICGYGIVRYRRARRCRRKIHYKLDDILLSISNERLGSGGQATVWKAMDERTGRLLAVKVGCDQQMKAEFDLLASLDHPNIVRVFGFLEENRAIVMELMGGGSLQCILDLAPTGLSLPTVIEYSKAILNGLYTLHGVGLIHRDLKPDNILLDSVGTCKIGDLGSAKDLEKSLSKSFGAVVGTLRYTPPEVLLSGSNNSKSGDIWSYGLCVLYMLSGRHPWHGADTVIEILSRLDGVEVYPLMDFPPNDEELPSDSEAMSSGTDDCSKLAQHHHAWTVARAFVSDCVQVDPSQRPSAEELLQHPFLQLSHSKDVKPLSDQQPEPKQTVVHFSPLTEEEESSGGPRQQPCCLVGIPSCSPGHNPQPNNTATSFFGN